jgi:hypothetical protein
MPNTSWNLPLSNKPKKNIGTENDDPLEIDYPTLHDRYICSNIEHWFNLKLKYLNTNVSENPENPENKDLKNLKSLFEISIFKYVLMNQFKNESKFYNYKNKILDSLKETIKVIYKKLKELHSGKGDLYEFYKEFYKTIINDIREYNIGYFFTTNNTEKILITQDAEGNIPVTINSYIFNGKFEEILNRIEKPNVGGKSRKRSKKNNKSKKHRHAK